MILDLRKDLRDIHQYVVKRVNAYVAAGGKQAVPISAIGITYEFSQRGWVIVHFDARPEHKRDGEMVYTKKDVFKCPHWFAAVKALCYLTTLSYDPECGLYGREIVKKPVTIILPNGTRKDGRKLTDKAFSAILGRVIKEAALKAKKDRRFKDLPKGATCQLDIEDFNGNWAWPAYEKLGKINRIR